jgi:putative nucleotidyltransferase with HDIG domain
MNSHGRLREFLLSRGRFRFLLSILLFGTVLASLVGVLAIGTLSSPMDIQAGGVAPRTVRAEKNIEIIDQQATDAAREAAASAVPLIFVTDYGANQAGEERLNQTFAILQNSAQPPSKKKGKPLAPPPQPDLPVTISPRSVETLLSLSHRTLHDLNNDARNLLWRSMQEGVRTNHINDSRRTLRDYADETYHSLPADQLQAIIEVASECLMPNKTQNIQATMGAQDAARAQVKPIRRIYPENAIVVHEGDILTAEKVQVLQAIGVNHPDMNYSRVMGYTLLVACMMTLTLAYLRRERHDLYVSPRYLMLISLVTVATASICRFLVALSPYLAPVATASIVLTILVEGRLAMMVTAYLALFVGVMTQSLPAACVATLAGAAGILALARADKRSHLIAATFVVALLSTTGALVFSLIYTKDLQTSLSDLSFAALNGLIAAAIAVGMLPTLEYGFGITTAFRLLDVSNPGEPLLQRLLKEAPGTYQHSIMVANLAESAAQAVGADALRCKVGAYYHDIGKMKRPRFFIENQMGAENPHERLAPSLSTMIIHAHVRDGIELARQHKLPDVIVDFIAEHHGTSLVTYFFHQACNRSSEPMREEDFRYPGPKPQTRETAIVLLCDGIEAAARTLSTPTPEKITELVHKMVKHALEDGQLDECDLSIKDLELIRESLIRSLQGIYHTRIVYPSPSALMPMHKNLTTLRKKA